MLFDEMKASATTISLRPYQEDAVRNTAIALKQHGSTLGVMPTGCVSGNSIIGFNRAGKGYSRTIAEEFASQSDPRRRADIDTMVRSFIGDRIGLHRATSIVFSGPKETLTLRLKNGMSLRLTDDHEVLTSNGFVAAASLNGAHRIIVEDRKWSGQRQKKIRQHYRQIQGLVHHPFAGNAQSLRLRGRNQEGRLFRVPYHRAVIEAHQNNLSLDEFVWLCRTDAKRAASLSFIDPELLAVHHRDSNVKNNAIENLEVLTHTDHGALHGQVDHLPNFGIGLIAESELESCSRFGIEDTYDIICDDPHRNFVANGIVVHNCGKTVVFVSAAAEQPKRTMIIAHREELIFQAANKVKEITGEPPCIEMADLRARRHNKSKIVVASIQTLATGRVYDFHPDEFSLVIIDEAHHAAATSYQKVVKHFAGVPLLGVTATPHRHDKRAMGNTFKSVAFRYELIDAMNDAYLVPIYQSAVRVQSLDFSGIATRQGDLANDQLAAVMEMEKNLHGIVSPTIELAGDRKTLVFASSVAHAYKIADILNRHKSNSAVAIDGKTPSDQRRMTLKRYAAGDFQYLINVGIATEGFDEPGIEVVVVGRPTESVALYTQMIGRGTRVLPGVIDGILDREERHAAIAASRKTKLDVLDFVGNSGKHTMINAINLLAGDENAEVVARAKKMAGDEPVNATQILQDARDILIVEAERRRREAELRQIKAKAEYETRRVDPFAGRGFRQNIAALRDEIQNHVERIVLPNIEREANNRCTIKQWELLRRFGYADEYTKEEAKVLIDAIAANGWRRPG